MFKAKLIGVLILVLGLFLGIFYHYSSTVTPEANRRLQDIQYNAEAQLREEMLLAEESLFAQAQTLASDESLREHLRLVREKLSVTPIKELKETSSNTWNKATFDKLMNWLQGRESAIKQGTKELSDARIAPRGSISSIYPLRDWLKSKPDLLLAFAQTPMNDGRVLPILVANAKQGAELQGGKAYEYELLTAVSEKRTPIANLINWDQKMFLAVGVPIFSNDMHIATIILGKELSRDLVESFSSFLQPEQFLMFYHSKPGIKPGNSYEKTTRKYYTAHLSETEQNTIVSSKYGSTKDPNATRYFDQLTEEDIFKGTYKLGKTSNDVAFKRVRLVWNSSEEVGAYIFTNLNSSAEWLNNLRTQMALLALALLAIGALGITLVVRNNEKGLKQINIALSESLASEKTLELDGIKVSGDLEQLVELLQKFAPASQFDEQNADGDVSDIWNQLISLDEEPEDGTIQHTGRESKPKALAKPEDECLRPLYEEYTAKRKENNVEEDMDFDRFVRRVHRNEEKIKKTYQCSNVEFEVQVNNGKVVLKPKISK